MSYHIEDTVVALASPPGGGARGIIRLSGPQTVAVVAALFRSSAGELANIARPGVLSGEISLDRLGRRLPATLYLWPDRRSYTRQPVAELHTLSSPPLLAAAVQELCRHGARPAEPGEFTLRAFLAGRIDLTQAEAVLGIIDARADGDLRVALEQLAGGLARPIAELRSDLLDLLARLEAGLDFVEEDIEFITAAEIADTLAAGRGAAQRLAEQLDARAAPDDSLRAALIGSPNVGKSSLFNALTAAGALVGSQPGTTRDYLVGRLDLDGLRCELVDTAGVDGASPSGSIDRQAQEQASVQTARAPIRLLCLDASRPPNAWELARLAASDPRTELVVLTKIDQADNGTAYSSAGAETWLAGDKRERCLYLPGAVETSARSGAGLQRLRERLRTLALESAQAATHAVEATAVRAGDSLERTVAALERAAGLNAQHVGDELVAAEVRAALDELGTLGGALASDDLLDRIFRRFCIGK
jgi:tRNA modification GTPase